MCIAPSRTMVSHRSADNLGRRQPQSKKAGLAKRERGRTPMLTTPLTIRSGVAISSEARSRFEQQAKAVLTPFGTRIERGSIRFEDVNGPRGGVDSKCTIKVVLSGGPSLIVEGRAASLRVAASRAMRLLGTQIRRRAKLDGGRTPQPTVPALDTPEPRRRSTRQQDGDSLIGKRTGRSAVNLAAALEPPEKERRDVYVDTAAPGISATDRRAGGPYSARRNSKRGSSGMTYALEDSRSNPSRKSTRASGNRTKAASEGSGQRSGLRRAGLRKRSDRPRTRDTLLEACSLQSAVSCARDA